MLWRLTTSPGSDPLKSLNESMLRSSVPSSLSHPCHFLAPSAAPLLGCRGFGSKRHNHQFWPEWVLVSVSLSLGYPGSHVKSPRRGFSGSPRLSFQFTGGVTWEVIRHSLVSVAPCETPLLIFHMCLRLHKKGLGEPEGLWGESIELGERRSTCPGLQPPWSFLLIPDLPGPKELAKQNKKNKKSVPVGAGPSREEKFQGQLGSLGSDWRGFSHICWGFTPYEPDTCQGLGCKKKDL